MSLCFKKYANIDMKYSKILISVLTCKLNHSNCSFLDAVPFSRYMDMLGEIANFSYPRSVYLTFLIGLMLLGFVKATIARSKLA